MARLRSGTCSVLLNAIRWCAPLGIALAAVDCAAAQSPPPSEVRATAPALAPAALSVKNAAGAPFSATDRAQITRRILADPQVTQLGSDRLRVLTVTPSLPVKDQPAGRANSILFDYNHGRAYRATIDLQTGSVTRLEQLPGRPQPSREEIAEAGRIAQGDPTIARIMQSNKGAVLEGGFAVDGPQDANQRDRFIQFHLVTRDRLHFLREITVDLTTAKVAASATRR